ncbi:MAG: hypothetical protein ACRCVU_04250 [Flavobacterium sp.]
MKEGISFKGSGLFFKISIWQIMIGIVLSLTLFFCVLFLVSKVMPTPVNTTMSNEIALVGIVIFFIIVIAVVFKFILPSLNLREVVVYTDSLVVYTDNRKYSIYYKDIKSLEMNVLVDSSALDREANRGFRFITTQGTYVITMLRHSPIQLGAESLFSQFYKVLREQLKLDELQCKQSSVFKKTYSERYRLR